jgi:hypothetical protein
MRGYFQRRFRGRIRALLRSAVTVIIHLIATGVCYGMAA